MVGKLRLDLFSEDEKTFINTSLKENKNLFYRTEYIEDEAEYNSICRLSDVIFSVYNDFDSSSNTLTKAAYFHVPILADAKSTVGNRVEEFMLGETAIQNDVDSILQALEKICSAPLDKYKFELYKNNHSFESLKNVLDHATKSWVN